MAHGVTTRTFVVTDTTRNLLRDQVFAHFTDKHGDSWAYAAIWRGGRFYAVPCYSYTSESHDKTTVEYRAAVTFHGTIYVPIAPDTAFEDGTSRTTHQPNTMSSPTTAKFARCWQSRTS